MEKELLSHLYTMSKDYCTLYHLVKVSRIICVVNYDTKIDGYQIRDVCQSQVIKDSEIIDIGCRGYSYIWATNKDDFIEQCKRKDLEYFIPNKDMKNVSK